MGNSNELMLAKSRLKWYRLLPFSRANQDGDNSVLRAEATNRLFTAFRSRSAGKFNHVRINSSKSVWFSTTAAAEVCGTLNLP